METQRKNTKEMLQIPNSQQTQRMPVTGSLVNQILDMSEERNSELEDRSQEFHKLKFEEEERMKKQKQNKKQNIPKLQNNVKRCNIHIIVRSNNG